MKKSVLALAVLGAFTGAVSAQSSVTLYGVADATISYVTPGDNVNDGDSVWKLQDGGANGMQGSRWGLRGKEDLGGGLNAYFVLESGFNLDTGAAADSSRLFNRQAFVALGSKSLGDVRFGRQQTLTRLSNAGFNDASGIAELSVDQNVGGRPLFQSFGQRVDNAIVYMTPNLSGFQVSGIVGLGEGPDSARHQGVQGTYKGGPMEVALTYEMYDGFDDTYNKVLTLAGNYNFGPATLFAGYQMTSDFGTQSAAPTGAAGDIEDYDAWNVGVLVPFGQFGIRAQYTQAKYDLFGGSDEDASYYGISARYALSKRTTLYSAITQSGGDNDDDFAIKREITLLGLNHKF